MTKNSSFELFLFIGIGIIWFIVFLLIYIIDKLLPFLRERKYLICEMQRSCGREYDYWKGKLKKLYISHIPIIGKWLG